MKIHLPNSAWIGNIDRFLRSFDTKIKGKLEITSHEKWVSVHPVVICMIASLGLTFRGKNAKINFEKIRAKSKHYFERMGLFQLLDLDSEISIKKHDSSGKFIPLSRITNSTELHTFITEMIPLLHLKSSQVEPIKYIISELVRNVFEHANCPFGAIVCAQYYEKSNIIRLGVCDVGMGIRQSIIKSYPADSDSKAIRLALTPGITGTTTYTTGTERNAGAGLFFIKSLAKVNRDYFMLYSGNTMYKLLKTPIKQKNVKLFMNPEKDHCSIKEDFSYWQGTVVGIDISLDKSKEFDVFLKQLRDAIS